MTFDRFHTCHHFGQEKCPYRTEMEKIYLIPQLLSVVEAKEYEDACLSCRHYLKRRVHQAESDTDMLI